MSASGTAYYNEMDRHAAAWLRELIAAGAIAPGVVDERDLRDVTPADLSGFQQCHFFAGIGVWSYALRLAGWPDDKPVWTGSCPCQPFSSAGKGAGFDDERHIWPYWHHLIRVCRPGVVFGEQVASADGLAWLDLVQDDLEGENYAARAIDCCAASVGAPHIRQRLWFVANADRQRCRETRHARSAVRAGRRRDVDAVADASGAALERIKAEGGVADSGQRSEASVADRRRRCRPARELGHDASERRAELRNAGSARPSGHVDGSDSFDRPGPTAGHWRDADWLRCRDGRWRAVEPGTFPLAHGVAGRVGLLRGYGNAINAETAAAVIRAAMPDL